MKDVASRLRMSITALYYALIWTGIRLHGDTA
jgi:hypothetical protein